MLGLDRRTAQQTWTVVFIVLLLVAVYLIRETLFVFTASLLFAYLLWPLVKLLDRRIPGGSKVWALAVVYLSLLALLVGVGIIIGSRIEEQASAFAVRIPELLSRFEKVSQPVGSSSLQTARAAIISTLGKQVSEHSQYFVSLLPNAALGVLSHVRILIFIVLVPILSFFFLKDGERISRAIMGIVASGPRRDSVNEVAGELNLLFAQYMRALVLLASVAFIAYGLFFSLIGVPFGILLAAIAFPLEFIPMVGPFTGAVIILAVAGLGGFHHLLWLIAFLLGFRVFQDYVLSPQLLSKGMELHPLIVIFGVLAGGSVAGIAGSFLSVPVLATLRIIFRQLRKGYGNSAGDTGEIRNL